MTPTAPENPSDAPETPMDAPESPAYDEATDTDPSPETEAETEAETETAHGPKDDRSNLATASPDMDASDPQGRPDVDESLTETSHDDLDSLDELLSRVVRHSEDPATEAAGDGVEQTSEARELDPLDEPLSRGVRRTRRLHEDRPPTRTRARKAASGGFVGASEEARADGLNLARTGLDKDPDASEPADQPASFSWVDVEFMLLSSPHPLRVLSDEVRRIKRNRNTVTAAERFLAQRVEDTGVLDKDVSKKVKFLSITSLTRSDLLYIRGLNARLDDDVWLSLISLEGILNLMRRAHERYDDLSLVSEADLSSLEHHLMERVLFEAPLIDTADWTYLAMPWQFPAGPAEHGEWSCRHQLAEAIEGLRLPWRLRARFHSNVSAGTLAIEFDATPADALPRHTYVADLGRLPTTAAWRAREASAYAARVGLLLASLGFASSRRIKSVFVKATHDTAERHVCLFSAEFDRRVFSHLRLQSVMDPVATLSALGASIDDENGELLPVPERFHLGDATFCPTRRHDIMTLTDHALPTSAAHALGARRLLDLSIHEELGRIIAADDILRHSSDATGDTSAEERVRAIMDVAASTSDLTVWDAATRVVRQIVEGKLSCDDVWALRDELVEGDDLSRALSRSKELFMTGDADKASRLIEEALAPLERQGLYRDSESVAYRSFDNFTERVLYNRMSADDTRVVSLVPDAYIIAHIALASIFLVEGQEDRAQLDRALRHVRRALDVAPMNTPATMLLSSVLEAAGDTDGSQEVLSSYLRNAFNPQGIGYAYLKLAEAAAQEGDERRAFSCYQMCLRTMPPLAPIVFAQSQMLSEQGLVFPDNMGMVEVQECLEAAGIPLAPTQHTFFGLFDGAIAATDAEVFPVARDIMSFIEALTGDDVMHAVRESLEREPDA